MMNKIAIFGLGYVGLPLAIEAHKSGYSIVGIDTSLSKVSQLNSGISTVEDISDDTVSNSLSSDSFKVVTELIGEYIFDVLVICVPTPLNAEHTPDLSCLISATKTAAKFVRPGSLVIIESTVETGTTRETVLPLLTSISGLHDTSFFLAFSPERVDPKNPLWNIRNTPKLVSALNKDGLNAAVKFYSRFIDTIIECSSLEVAETAKLLENSFRLVNISFINEFFIYCQKIGISINEVIHAAASKPYGFMTFYPSIGIGGHCIPIDPIYLANRAKNIGVSTDFIDLAIKVNHQMPLYFVKQAFLRLGTLSKKRILVIGISYKPNMSDTRETPVASLIRELRIEGAEVFWHDDLVEAWNGETSVPLSDEYDLAIIATPHDYLDLTKLRDLPILNTRESIQ